MTVELMSGDVLPGMVSPRQPRGLVLGVLAVSVAASVPTAAAWWLVAPLQQLLVAPEGVLAVGDNTEAAIAADGWFAICAAVAGAVCAVVVFLRLRVAAVGVLFGLAVGGLAGAVAAWRLGMFIGPPPLEVQAKMLSVGDRFEAPLELSALGVLAAWPLAAVAVYFSLVAGVDAGPQKFPPAGANPEHPEQPRHPEQRQITGQPERSDKPPRARGRRRRKRGWGSVRAHLGAR